MDNFTNVVESAEKSIAVKLNLNTQKQIEENRKNCFSIVIMEISFKVVLTTKEISESF